MFEQAKREAYRKLAAPLPIQSRQKIPTHSLFSFVQEQPKESILFPPEIQELSSNAERISFKKTIHQIGQSLPLLFQSPVYKSHEQLNIADNEHFCSWQTDENYKFISQKVIEERTIGNLSFQSRFQSGNLGLAAQAGNSYEYYLAIQRDINSASTTTQWFYFKVNCKNHPGSYTFHIVNYVKPFSMFKAGMKPCVLSVGKSARWQRGGNNIQYRKNSIPLREGESYYTFSFSYDFTQRDSSIYFAYCYPYTYSRLIKFLDGLQSKHHDKMRRKMIARTNGGNAIQLISITNPLVLNKKLMYITARVHPGQTVSSFVCEAMIEFFLSNHPSAEKIREQFIIKIVPMLNPDGVINGSYRCSLSGSDLNREWKNPCKNSHPQIYHLKKAIVEGEYKKLLFLDIHGHSKKRSSFMYGCVGAKSPYAPKELPYLLSRRMNNFSYHTCNFAVSKAKEGTARISLWRSGIQYSYTYEVSFCGPQKERRHFNVKDLYQLGSQLSKNLCNYFYSRILQLQIDQQLNKHCQDFYNEEQLINMGNQQTNGSSSELQDELPQQFKKKQIKRIHRSNRTHNTTQKTETGRLNDLLEQYMLKKGKKQQQQQLEERDKSKQKYKEKEIQKEEKSIYLRQRQSFMATRVNLTQIPQTQSIYTCLSTYYGFAAQKGTGGLDQGRSMSLKNSYDGGSNSQRKGKPGQSFGILLPNVQKGQYRRYERSQRYKKEKIPERSVSEYVQNIFQQNQSIQMRSNLRRFEREMSLGDRIKFKNSQKSGNKF